MTRAAALAIAMVGEIEVSGATYRVECHSQSEDREPPGDWCVP